MRIAAVRTHAEPNVVSFMSMHCHGAGAGASECNGWGQRAIPSSYRLLMSERARDISEAVLLVIKRLMKWAVLALISIILLGAVAYGGYWGWEYVRYELPKAKVQIVTNTTEKRCNDAYPIFVGIVNRSDRTVLRTRVRLQAFQPNRSTNLESWNDISDDRIIRPGDGWGRCVNPGMNSNAPENVNLRELDWSVARYDLEFE